MSSGYGDYEERTFHRGDNGYTDSRTINVQDVTDDFARHTVTPYHSYELEPCRECAWTRGYPQREFGPTAVVDYVRRNHRKVDKINRTISAKAVWSEVHPKAKQDGSYPKEFFLPKTVDDFRAMDISVLDRILLAYHLGADSDQRKNRQESRHRKLSCLFEFLGADNLPGKRGEVREEDLHHVKHERNVNGASGRQ